MSIVAAKKKRTHTHTNKTQWTAKMYIEKRNRMYGTERAALQVRFILCVEN